MAENSNIEWTDQVGQRNPNWRGGRIVASNGYVIVRVGTAHHLSDVRGYAYEHRIVAESIIGRQLLPGEIVHHVDGDKQNNTPSNLRVVNGNAEHFLHHRKRSDLQMPKEHNITIACECGCGAKLAKFDCCGRPRRFISGHNPQKSPVDDSIKLQLSQHGQMRLQEIVCRIRQRRTTHETHWKASKCTPSRRCKAKNIHVP